jgi:hypothetical protein
VSLETCIGADLFFRESFGGNGRSCGSCHPAANNFTIDPEFIASLSANDSLFIAERGGRLEQLEDSDLLVEHALVKVNADGFEVPTEKFVMRSVSHVLSMATTITPAPLLPNGTALDGTTVPPRQRTGWSGDGAPGEGTLREFPEGAIVQHMTNSLEREPYVDFVLPTSGQLDSMEQFQTQLGRTNELELEEVQLTDAAAERGRLSFLFGTAQDCSLCHRNAGANNMSVPTGNLPVNPNFNIGSEEARLPILDTLGIPHDGGFGREPLDMDGDGVFDAFGDGTFNSQPLIEAADTAPFYHTNAFATIEEAIAFYTTDEFAESPIGQVAVPGGVAGAIPLSEQEIVDLGRFLRVLNASFNCQLALARLQGAFQIVDAFGNRFISIQRGLLELAAEELDDALKVLGDVDALNVEVQAELREVQREINVARHTLRRSVRLERTRRALWMVARADDQLGTGIDFEVGEGTLMF